jgi:gliding motility-associated-like protein
MAQLTSPGSVSVRNVTYPSVPGRKDKAFFYCNSQGTDQASLNAIRTGHNGPRNFTWYKWNDLTSSFSVILKSDPGVLSSEVYNLGAGGYKVELDSLGTYDTTFVGWIFYDTPPVANAALAQQLCYRVALSGTASASTDKFTYKDINTGASLYIPNEMKHLWSSDPDSYIPAPDVYLNPVIQNYPSEPPFIDYRLPLEDLTYKFSVSSLACSSESSFLYHSIHVKADFNADPLQGQSPLEVAFTNKSVRASLYTWKFGDKSESTNENPDPHTYYIPGKYSVTLIIESDLHCIDSLRMDSLIYVEPSALDIPNAFTPNDDGYNDRFMVYGKSLRYISMEVFSQSGMKVYGFNGENEALKNWTGWDGNINNSSVKAAPGIYFYIISALGWDDIDYKGKKYRGFLYLYR